ncbi:MAG TPA: GreA/GreB family elongation factor [Povalibacter sp.]|nr:GreA/GreB family elongation factor [Povalibacter sp.]
MSRAFVKEQDGADIPEDFPERPVSAHPNFVTARGLRQIETEVHALEARREQARRDEDKPTLTGIERDLRYWQQRKASARLTEPESPAQKIRFGMRVALQLHDGGERQFVLVGEDEADPAGGLISWVSPVAQQLLGKEVGDEIELQGHRAEIIRIDIPPA